MIYNVENGDIVYAKDGCTGARLYACAGNEYVHLSIKSGGGIPVHALAQAVSFYVLKGEGVCSVGGERFTVSEGDMLECEPNKMRGWENQSHGLLEVLVIKRFIS